MERFGQVGLSTASGSDFVAPPGHSAELIRLHTPVPLSMVVAKVAEVLKLSKIERIRRTFLCVIRPGELPTAEAIISKLRATFALRNADFFVSSERPGRLLICVLLSNVTTKSPRVPAS